MNRQQRRAAVATMRSRASWDWCERVITDEERAKYPACKRIATAFYNDLYSVQVYLVDTDIGRVQHLIIREQQANREPPWRDLQRIKNELVGVDRVAVQVYPRDEDLVDQADVYHLWVLPSADVLPFGLHRENGLTKGGR